TRARTISFRRFFPFAIAADRTVSPLARLLLYRFPEEMNRAESRPLSFACQPVSSRRNVSRRPRNSLPLARRRLGTARGAAARPSEWRSAGGYCATQRPRGGQHRFLTQGEESWKRNN